MSEELKAAQARIACLEGETAKRDEVIVGLTNSRDFWREKAIAADDELAAIKAQEPVAWAGAIEYGVPLLMVEPQNWKATPLYAAPVSEAKAQGVVQWPNADEIMQMAFEEGQPADDASGYYFELEEFDLFIERLMSEVARLNAAPAQQVVPDGSTKMQWPEIVALVNEVLGCEAHKYPCERGSIGHEMTGINFNSLARIIDRVRYASPAAPAADAGGVLEQAMYTLISIGYHENSGLVHELRQALAAHSAKGVV